MRSLPRHRDLFRPIDPTEQVSQRGFTLVEIMVASTFFIIVLNVIFNLHTVAVGNLQKAASYDRAAGLLLDISETLQLLAPADLQAFVQNTGKQAFTRTGLLTTKGATDAFYAISAAVVRSEGDRSQLDVQLSWQDAGNPLQRTISSSSLVKLQ